MSDLLPLEKLVSKAYLFPLNPISFKLLFFLNNSEKHLLSTICILNLSPIWPTCPKHFKDAAHSQASVLVFYTFILSLMFLAFAFVREELSSSPDLPLLLLMLQFFFLVLFFAWLEGFSWRQKTLGSMTFPAAFELR